MCQFLSAIIMKSGDILCDPEHTDSHEDLILANNLNDGKTSFFHQSFCRVEFLPPPNFKNIANLDKWKLKLNENERPQWYKEDEIRRRMQNIVKRMFISGRRQMLLGGYHILLPRAKVDNVKNSRIYMMYEDSYINGVFGSSRIDTMYGNSIVAAIYEDSQIKIMAGHSLVDMMFGHSLIITMLGESKVNTMSADSQINTMLENSQVHKMINYSKINVMYEYSKVNELWGDSQIKQLFDNAKIVNDYREKSSTKSLI